MWGHIIADLSFHTNYSLGFPESNSDIILNLTHWQYWWWFWFTYLLTIYYFIFLKLLKQRTLKFYPKIVTSYRSHGKWGDFIVCFLPISWCVNILSNSNFILRMIEWQTESNLFTIRIRGRQWYWVYKIEIKTLLDVTRIPKNLSYNYWVLFNHTNLKYTEDYINILQLKNSLDVLLPYINEASNRLMSYPVNSRFFNSPAYWVYARYWEPYASQNLVIYNKSAKNLTLDSISYCTDRMTRYHRFNYYANFQALKLDLLNNDFLLKFNQSNNHVTHRFLQENIYLVIKQKRYTPSKKLKYFNNKSMYLKNFSTLEFLNIDKGTTNLFHKTLRSKSNSVSSIYYRRLLRTRRILVLPTNINITLITNSFDVVHSWYIPGIGIKLDCIPGRSTHHTINIDHAGFYYGQCAEICGRYHHHMPIRVCALPFEHFLIWWYQYGIPYFNAFNTTRKKTVKSGMKQYNW